MKTIRIGGGSAWEMDRIEPALALAERGNLDYLCFDVLAQRTLALAQRRKLIDAKYGYNPQLAETMELLLPICARSKLRLVGSWGAADPVGAGLLVKEIAGRLGCKGLKIATIIGDDVLARITDLNPIIQETQGRLSDLKGKIVSANAYLGCEGIVEALRGGAKVVIGGRIADPSLFLGPMVHEFGWSAADWDRLAAGQAIGHLLECSSQVTGGNFADPGYCEVPGLDDLGFPFAEVGENGEAIIGKLEDSGGLVSAHTCKSQLVYEVLDPGNYITPDMVLDFRPLTVRELEKDRVRVAGAVGRPRPPELKVSIGVFEGFVGEGEVSYAGTGSLGRARLFLEVIRKRLARLSEREGGVLETKFDLIGVNSLFGPAAREPEAPPNEVRARFAARCTTERVAQLVSAEAGYAFQGPAGGGGGRNNVRPVLAIYTTFVPREMVQQKVEIEEV